jgi:hypothetical protein
MRRQRVQMDGQILLGVLDLTRGRRRDSGAGSIHPAVALLFDQIAGTVQHAAHGQAVLVSYGNVGHMGNFPPPGAQSSKFAAAEEAGATHRSNQPTPAWSVPEPRLAAALEHSPK